MKKKTTWIVLTALFCFFAFAGLSEAPASISLPGNVTIPVPDGFEENYTDQNIDMLFMSYSKAEETVYYSLYFQAQYFTAPDNSESLVSIVSPYAFPGETIEKLRWYTVNGRPATVWLSSTADGEYSSAGMQAKSSMVLDETILQVSLEVPASAVSAVSGEELLDQLQGILAQVSVGGSPVTIGETEQIPVICTGDDDMEILTGEACSFSIVGDPQEVADMFGSVQWTVRAQNGELPEGITISEDGLLTVARNAVKGVSYFYVDASFEKTGKTASSYFSVKPNPDDVDESQADRIDTLPELDAFFEKTYLAYNTIPEENRVSGNYSIYPSDIPLRMKGTISKCTFTYVSGDEALLDAINFSSYARLDLTKLTDPGEVTFRLRAIALNTEGRTSYHEKEYTLRVAACQEPVMEFLSETPEISVSNYGDDSMESIFNSIAKRTEAGTGMALTGMRIDGDYYTTNMLNSFIPGDHTVRLGFCFSTACYETDAVIHVIPYMLRGPEQVYPGQQVQYTVVRLTDYSGNGERVDGFTLRVEGNAEGPDDNGSLVISPDASVGETLRIIAESTEGNTTLVKACTVQENPLKGMKVHQIALGNFTVPLPDGIDFRESEPEERYQVTHVYSSGNTVDFAYELDERMSAEQETEDLQINMILDSAKFEPDEEYSFTVNDWPAMVFLRRYNSSEFYYFDGRFTPAEEKQEENQIPDRWVAQIRMVQDNKLLTLTIHWRMSFDALLWAPPVTVEDLVEFAKQITYNGEPMVFGECGPVPSIRAEGSRVTLVSGEKLQFEADEASLALTGEYGEIEWKVKPVSASSRVRNVTISKTGEVITKGNSLDMGTADVFVIASYKNLPDVSIYRLTIFPALKKITPSINGFVYMGQEDVVVSIVPEPEEAICGKVEWSVDHPEVVEWYVDENNLLHLKPLQVGKFTIKAVEESNKKANVKVTVSERPVTELRITLQKGTPVAGGKMTFAAELSPEKPDCKDIRWSVSPSYIGDINKKGVLSIGHFVESGTEFTVTCEALGAPEPVVATLTYTVE